MKKRVIYFLTAMLMSVVGLTVQASAEENRPAEAHSIRTEEHGDFLYPSPEDAETFSPLMMFGEHGKKPARETGQEKDSTRIESDASNSSSKKADGYKENNHLVNNSLQFFNAPEENIHQLKVDSDMPKLLTCLNHRVSGDHLDEEYKALIVEIHDKEIKRDGDWQGRVVERTTQQQMREDKITNRSEKKATTPEQASSNLKDRARSGGWSGEKKYSRYTVIA